MKHAYVRLENDGVVSIRWWVDGPAGVSARTIVTVRPGELAFDVDYAVWARYVGTFVDIDEVRHEAVARPDIN